MKTVKGKVINIYCAKCRAPIYKYWKDKPGHLIKCYTQRILKDFTRQQLHCPKCGEQFARKAIIHQKPAHKIIQGKVIIKH